MFVFTIYLVRRGRHTTAATSRWGPWWRPCRGRGRGGAGAAGAESWGGSLQGCVLHGHRHYCRLMACALAGAPHHTARTSVYCPAPVLATSPAQPAPGENTVLPAPPCLPASPARPRPRLLRAFKSPKSRSRCAAVRCAAARARVTSSPGYVCPCV